MLKSEPSETEQIHLSWTQQFGLFKINDSLVNGDNKKKVSLNYNLIQTSVHF